MKLGIIVAMDKELQSIVSLFDNLKEEIVFGKSYYFGSVEGKEVVLTKSGIGKVNASMGALEMIQEFSPDYIISCGVAGGASVSRLSTVVGNQYAYHDVYCGKECAYGQVQGQPSHFEANEHLLETARQIPNVTEGLIVSGDWFVDSKEKMGYIIDKFPSAKAVDMESCAIAQTCHAYGVPFVSFRTISDVPLADSEGEQYIDFWSKMADNSFAVTKEFIFNV